MAPKSFDVAEEVLACVCEALDETDAECPTRRCSVGGALAWESCGDGSCGQLSVQLINQYASSSFPTPSESTAGNFGAAKCGHPIMVVSYQVTVMRCAPTGGPHGEPPACEDLAAAAQVAASDAEAVFYSTQCCLQGMYQTRGVDNRRVIDGWTTGTLTYVGPQGGCLGVSMPFRIKLTNNCACP